MTDWAPIETAPKDGRYVLISFQGEARLARWVQPDHESSPWQWAQRDSLHGEFRKDLVTHWMPFPPPPHNSAETTER